MFFYFGSVHIITGYAARDGAHYKMGVQTIHSQQYPQSIGNDSKKP